MPPDSAHMRCLWTMQGLRIQHTMPPDPAHVAPGVRAQCRASDEGLPGSSAEPPDPAHEASGFGTLRCFRSQRTAPP
eukprot:9699602-Alexandrium_andersonii.AAC.1